MIFGRFLVLAWVCARGDVLGAGGEDDGGDAAALHGIGLFAEQREQFSEGLSFGAGEVDSEVKFGR